MYRRYVNVVIYCYLLLLALAFQGLQSCGGGQGLGLFYLRRKIVHALALLLGFPWLNVVDG
jgi:hypothetical protein